MVKIRHNERSEAIRLISYMNSFLGDKTLSFQSAGGESTITEGKDRMFPDVILYGDTAQTLILQGWEVKMPDVPISDSEFIKDAQRKAITLGLNSCFLWNFTYGVLYTRSSDNQFHIEKQWDTTAFIKTRADVDTYRNDWEKLIKVILTEINEFFIKGRFSAASLGDVITNTILAEIIKRNKATVAETLEANSLKDARIQALLSQWWGQVKVEYVRDEPNQYFAYARVILLNWTNRIVFAHLIKKFHNTARLVDSLDYSTSPSQANELFITISSECDYYNIFTTFDLNTVLPDCTWRDLMEFNEFLTGNGVGEINQTSLQTILEQTVSASKRELIGQFTTPIKLASLLSRLTILNLHNNCIDPCCGTGSIPQAVLNYKISRGIPVNQAMKSTWASDKYSFPLQIASISLARADAMNQPVRVFQQNVFELFGGQIIKIVDPSSGERLECKLPTFEAIVSNLPFVPFEIINADEKLFLEKIRAEVKAVAHVELAKRSDLYQYIIFSLWRLLNDEGRVGVITSNSWLGTRAGQQFFTALMYYYNVEQIHISGQGRWFHNADVVTAILILSKKQKTCEPDPRCKTAFYKWNKDLDQMTTADIDTLANDALLGTAMHLDLLSMSSYSIDEVKRLLGLNISLNALFHKADWLLNLSNKMCAITDFFAVIRGERRGWDKMFYPPNDHGIESQYIQRVLKSGRQLLSYSAESDSDAFCCSESLESLTEKGHTGAIRWIHSFEYQQNEVGELLPSVLARRNMYWYEMSTDSVADFVTSMNPDRRLFVARLNKSSFINQRLIGFKSILPSNDLDLLHALLNSILSMFYIEAIGFGRGLGVLDINATNIRNMRILNPALLSPTERDRIVSSFAAVKVKQVMNTVDELSDSVRAQFDHIVLKSYSLDDYYDEIKSSLLSMQAARHSVRE